MSGFRARKKGRVGQQIERPGETSDPSHTIIEVEDNGPVDMWLYDSGGYMVDTTDLDIFNPNNVKDTVSVDGWYLLETRPEGRMRIMC